MWRYCGPALPQAQSRGSLQPEQPGAGGLEETGAGGCLPGLLDANSCMSRRSGCSPVSCLLQHSFIDAVGTLRGAEQL